MAAIPESASCLGSGYEGRGAFSNSITIYFTADLSPWIGDNAWSLIYVNNPMLRGFFRMNRTRAGGLPRHQHIGRSERRSAGRRECGRGRERARLIELVRAGVGDPDLAVRIDGYTRWRATANVAQKFQDRRIFIAGDAAHLMPPNGGFGGNTGIHDAHNLAWKLAMVIQGHASPNLLDSYATERKPVARFTVEQAFSRYVARTAPWLQASQQPEPLVDDLQHRDSATCMTPFGVHADPRTTRGVPGSRAPHLWLTRAGSRLSTIDLTGHYLLLAGADGGMGGRGRRRSARALPRTAARCLLHRQGSRRPRGHVFPKLTGSRIREPRWCDRTVLSLGEVPAKPRTAPVRCMRP